MQLIIPISYKLYQNSVSTILLLVISFFSLKAQDTNPITNSYNNNTSSPREVAYLHLNKSTYIKGEDIGFTAYVFDKKTKKNSQIATNLYVTIEDNNNKVIKKKLLKLENGIVSNVFELDSSFTSGYYVIKAYTNWMRNFNQQDYFAESIRVIDSKKEKYLETNVIQHTIDAQFLPESGHLLNNVNNTVGVIIKDQNGYGIPNATGKVYDKNNLLISEFKVNHLGIGKFLLLAENGNDYNIKIQHQNKDYNFDLIEPVEPVGVVINAVESRNKAYITLLTNKESLNIIKNKPYTLTLHNGSGIYTQNINFNASTSLLKSFDLSSMPVGLNIFTLFDENNNPIAERLFFNYNGIKKLTSQSVKTQVLDNYINLKVSFGNIDPNKFNTISVSVLPTDTKCYNRQNNIIAYNFLQPYIKGQIENPKYYFTEIDSKTKLHMDNLLLTQGWSSYDWNTIFNTPLNFNFPFEQGLTIKANVNSNNNENAQAYIVDINNENKGLIIKPPKDQKFFLLNNVFLKENESIYITELNKNSMPDIPKLYLQSSPNKIPYLDKNKPLLQPKQNDKISASISDKKVDETSLNNVQNLNEILIATKRDDVKIRTDELNKRSFRNNVKVITEEDRQSFLTLEEYMRVKGGVIVNESRSVRSGNANSGVTFSTGRSQSPNKKLLMEIFVDDAYFGTSIAPRFFFMSQIDYIEISKTGLGTGASQAFKGTGGIIRIYTNPKTIQQKSSQQKGKLYDFPLKFSDTKKFYIPKYKYYDDDFFLHYGTIDWQPQISSDANGNFNFNIRKTSVPVTLYIEGVANDGSFISEEKTISLN